MSGTALLLPGQGSQFVGMGADLAEQYPEAAELYAEAEEALGVPLRRLCREGPTEELTRTENAQPAILTHSYVVWRLLPQTLRDSVVVAAGHSLGEFTAYLCAGTLTFGDALRIVRRRGELMARARNGTMAAVIGLDDGKVRELCAAAHAGVVVAANFNAPGQVVISGDGPGVEEASTLAREGGARRVLPLEVSGAFHSPLMEVAREGLADALTAATFRDPEFPVVANASARPVGEAGEARRLLLEQLTSPVRWVESIGVMREMGVGRWLEIGPGSVLCGLLRRIDRSLETGSVGSAEDVRAWREAEHG
jgi:[acyl-carrier-protein] S-malonyltransferase